MQPSPESAAVPALGSVPLLPRFQDLTSGSPASRQRLCRLAQPCLWQIQRTPQFTFHEATLLLVLEGTIEFQSEHQQYSPGGPPSLILVDPHTSVDLVKTPAAKGGVFRSVMLEVSAPVLATYQQDLGETWAAKPPAAHAAFRGVPLDTELLATLWSVCMSVDTDPVSDRRLRYRIWDLLAALSERGMTFADPGLSSTSNQLRQILADRPAHRWTAREAGQALAMSESTLRRRLVQEHARFENILLDVRMHHAMMLLQTTHWSIPQVAQACGYHSRARFSDRFRTRFGQLPSTIR